jgi:hypothetical protein
MSEYDWQDDTDEVQETNAMRVLREKAEADSKVIREMAERLAKMEARENESKVDGLIVAKGLDPKVKDLIPKDTDPEKFLADYGALFATKQAEAEAEAEGSEDEGEVPADEVAARAAVANAASGAAPKAGLDATEAKIKDFDNAEDLLAFLATQ